MRVIKRHAVAPVLLLLIGSAAGCASGGRGSSEDRTLITAEDIEKYPNEPIEMIIQRKVPGVTVSRNADGEIALSIRGAATISGVPERPLYILNDIPIQPGPSGGLSGVNPYDIASIRVLRGVDAAIYGIDGANGVIIIRTKGAPKPKE